MRSLIAVVLVAGCSLYQNNKDDCLVVPVHTEPSQLIRDPVTGQCHPEAVCDPCGGPCPTPPPGASGSVIGGGAVCFGACEKLSEAACLDATTCHTAYRTDARGVSSFVGCWAVPAGAPPGGSADCANRNPNSCAAFSACATWYTGPSDDNMTFDHCEAERESCEPGTCGAPPPCPSNSVATTRDGCFTGHCLARSECPASMCLDFTSEAQCNAFSQCEALFHGDDCTCTPDTCTCAKRTFVSCHDRQP